jgi:hypothetical protein
MTEDEWRIVNSLASQLQHFRDRDGKQYIDQGLDDLLDRTQAMLNENRLKLLRGSGPFYLVSERELRQLQVLVWGARMIFEHEPREFNDVIDAIRSRTPQ